MLDFEAEKDLQDVCVHKVTECNKEAKHECILEPVADVCSALG